MLRDGVLGDELVGEYRPLLPDAVGTVDGLGLTLDAPARVQATTSPPSATKPAAPTRDADVIDRNEERARSECEIALAEVAKADEGTRNNALLKFIYTLRDRGISKELCFEYGLRFANEKCSPSYDVGQARATIRSAIRSARNQAGSRSEIEEVRGAAIARDFEVLSDHEQAKPMFTLASSRVTQASILAVEPPEFIVTRGKHGYMTRGLNGVLAGTGGISKTTFILTLMICFATGHKFLDHFTVKAPIASLLVSAEDSLDELRRRLKRVCVDMALSPAEWAAVEKYVHVVSLMDQPHAIIARGDYGGFRRTDFCTRLRDACTSLPIQPEFIALDPVSHLAEADEVDNAARAALANEAAKLADTLNATVFLVSHVSKAAVSSGEAAALTARGGQALTDNTRHTWSLGGVDEKLAGRMTNVDVLGVEPEEDLVGLTVQKHNPGSTMKKAFYFSKADGVPQALPEQPSFKTRGSAGAEARRIDQVPARNWVIDEVTKNSGKHTTESLVAGLRESHKVGDRWARDRVVAIRKEGIIVPRSITPDDRSKFQHAPQARVAYWPSEKGA